MEVSGPAKPIGSFLMETMAVPRISQRDVVEFCTAAICHSCCLPVPLQEPVSLYAELRGQVAPPNLYFPGISLCWDQRGDGGESRTRESPREGVMSPLTSHGF